MEDLEKIIQESDKHLGFKIKDEQEIKLYGF